jgi:hypothetical protein
MTDQNSNFDFDPGSGRHDLACEGPLFSEVVAFVR